MSNSKPTKENNRKLAIDRIVTIAQRISAQAVYYFSILGAASLIVTNTNAELLPPSLAFAASGIGVNLISNLIERLATGEKVSDSELEAQIQHAIRETGIEQLLTREEFIVENQKVLDLAFEIMNELTTIRSDINLTLTDSYLPHISVNEAIIRFLDRISLTRSENTARGYRNAMKFYQNTLADYGVSTSKTDISELTDYQNTISWLTTASKGYSPATERLYISVIRGFYKFLAEEQLSLPNIPRLEILFNQRTRVTGPQFPQFSQEAIENIMTYASTLSTLPAENDQRRLRNFRDRAFIFTLADTGMRVQEACSLRLGDVNWNQARVVLKNRNNRQGETIGSLHVVLRYLRSILPFDLLEWRLRKPPDRPAPLCPP